MALTLTLPGWSRSEYTGLSGAANPFQFMPGTTNVVMIAGGDQQINANVVPQSVGKFYCEFTATASDNGGAPYCCGLIQPTFMGPNSRRNYSAVGNTWVYEGGGVSVNGRGAGDLGMLWGAATSSVLGMAVDLGAKLIWYRINGGLWNGSSAANPATGVGGADISMLPFPLLPFLSVQNGIYCIFTFNGGNYGSGYAYAAPFSYNTWPAGESLELSDSWSNYVPLGATTPPTNTAIVGKVNVATTIQGSCSSVIAPVINYTYDNGATWQVALAQSYAYGLWTAELPASNTPSSHMFYVRDGNNTGVISGYSILSISDKRAVNGTRLPIQNLDPMNSGPQGGGPWTKQTDYNYNHAPFPPWQDTDTSINVGFNTNIVKGTSGGPDASAYGTWTGYSNDMLFSFDLFTDAMPGASRIDFGGGSLVGQDQFSFHFSSAMGTFYAPYGEAHDTGIVFAFGDGVPASVSLSCEIVFMPTEANGNGTNSYIASCNGTLLSTGTRPDGSGKNDAYFNANDLPSIVIATSNSAAPTTLAVSLALSNIAWYDLSLPAESIKITRVVAHGGNIVLSGSNAGSLAAMMDYCLDDSLPNSSVEWPQLSDFSAGLSWSGTGPVITSGTHTIKVRDDLVPSIISDDYTFSISNGIFVWNGIKLNPN